MEYVFWEWQTDDDVKPVDSTLPDTWIMAPIPQTKEVHDLGFINLMLKQTSGPPLLQTQLEARKSILGWEGKGERDWSTRDISSSNLRPNMLRFLEISNGTTFANQIRTGGVPATSPSIKLVQPEHVAIQTYCSLSHRWSGKPPLTTTKDNIVIHQNGVRFETLPQTFKDAVLVTQNLGCNFLWIDALCVSSKPPRRALSRFSLHNFVADSSR
jgi:hypothetical protein